MALSSAISGFWSLCSCPFRCRHSPAYCRHCTDPFFYSLCYSMLMMFAQTLFVRDFMLCGILVPLVCTRPVQFAIAQRNATAKINVETRLTTYPKRSAIFKGPKK